MPQVAGGNTGGNTCLLARTAHRYSDCPCPTGRYQAQMAGKTQTVEERDQYVRVATAAARLDCSPRLVKELVLQGQLVGLRFGEKGHWRNSTRSLDELIARSRR